MYRNLPMWQIPIELHRRIPQLPIICDPSHIGGKRELIAPLCQQAMDLGFEGLIVESHCNPNAAWSDAKQQVLPEELDAILSKLVVRDEYTTTDDLQNLRAEIDQLDDQLMNLLSKRLRICREIGQYKMCIRDRRNIIGELELDQTLTSRDTINTKLRAVLDDATNKWGIKVNRVELQDITPPESVLQAMEKQMQAERNKRATILTSEGEKQAAILQSEGEKTSTINRAEATKQQAILYAEGEATARIRKAEAEAIAIQKITEAVGQSTNPANYLLAQKYIAMMQELASGNQSKTVYLPYEATNLLGSIGGIKDLFKTE